jgi:hypothetical protein
MEIDQKPPKTEIGILFPFLLSGNWKNIENAEIKPIKDGLNERKE